MQMKQEHWAEAQRAETLRLSGAYEQAIEIFEQLREEYSCNAWVNAHLGTTYCQLMDYGNAEKYLTTAVIRAVNKNNDKYLWAYAQLAETCRLRAITEHSQDCKNEYIENAINYFKIALNIEDCCKTKLSTKELKKSNYAWALAHLGATYRLKLTDILPQLHSDTDWVSSANEKEPQNTLEGIKKDALKCLNKAIELIPTYTWAWGMRATIYRLVQNYENSLWDLAVETVITPEIEILQHSSSPIPFLESKRVALYEHGFLYFYLTKQERGKQKERNYVRAIAHFQKALILKPGDLIAQLMLIIIEGSRQKDKQGGHLTEQEINQILKRLDSLSKDTWSDMLKICRKILFCQIQLGQITKKDLTDIKEDAGEDHPLVKYILKEKPDSKEVDKNPQLWLWENLALTQTGSSVLCLFSDLSVLLNERHEIGTPEPYRRLAKIINPSYTIERLYQTPVLKEDQRKQIFQNLGFLPGG
ncbi:MAG: hypothetical protein SW833_12035 [Cyanobacteriota bacterium]|nr:hypothetical protein [Cyanobacteriota bacterium]